MIKLIIEYDLIAESLWFYR